MPQRITEQLVRKRAEHNNLEITTLEEVSLHQLDIEKIEHLDKWCRDLKILYLQSNLISKIENVGRLKKLEYLNLALNSITTIENLEGCESLEKLDLTVNFVGDLTSVESLKGNYLLRELFLTGNPCTEYEGYREYVVGTLPQLKWLDGTEITKSERIQAMQKLEALRVSVLEQQEVYHRRREAEKEERKARKLAKAEKKRARGQPGFDGRWYTDIGPSPSAKTEDTTADSKGTVNHTRQTSGKTNEDDSDVSSDDEELEGYTPESRLATHLYMEKKRKDTTKKQEVEEQKKPRTLFRDGRPLNVNEGKYDFTLTEDEEHNQYVLDVSVPRFMDLSLLEADVQPTYVRLVIKGKYFQLALQEEVSSDSSSAKRSQTTGHVVITMPKAKPVVRSKTMVPTSSPPHVGGEKSSEKKSPQLLEVDPTVMKTVDLSNIVGEHREKAHVCTGRTPQCADSATPSSDFVDNPEVPPLI